MFTDNAIVQYNENVVSTVIEGEIILMSVDSGEFICLNNMGSAIWKTLAEPITVANLCNQLREQYRVDENICRSEVSHFLMRLHEKNIVTVKVA